MGFADEYAEVGQLLHRDAASAATETTISTGRRLVAAGVTPVAFQIAVVFIPRCFRRCARCG